MKEKIEKEIKRLDEEYDYYLDKQDTDYNNSFYPEKIKELRIELRVYKNVLEMLENECEKE